jgi:hypothetical protein
MIDNEDIQEQSIDTSLNNIFGNVLNGINTCMPGYILSYDNSTQLAKVQPIFKTSFLNDDNEEIIKDRPPIENVPVIFFRAGGYFISFPVSTNDPVLLVFSQRSIDAYMETDGKKTIDPIDNRKFDLSDCFCIPGMITGKNKLSNTLSNGLKIAKEDDSTIIQIASNGEVQIKAGAVRLGSLTANKALALAQETNARLSAIESSFNTHTHIGNLGFPTLVPIVPITPPNADVSSTKVFTSA